MPMPAQRRQVWFSGTVQGVGFRYTTRSIARNFEVVGFVRNLSDGRVQLVAEGAAEELDAFLRAVQATLGHYVASCAVEPGPATGQFDCFEIRF